MNRSRLLSSTLTVSILRLAGQGIALISGVLISNYFGATSATDNYYAALILPPALANLVINILTNLFSPLYLEHIQQNPDEQRSILASFTFVVTLGLAAGLIIALVAVPISVGLRSLTSPTAVEQAYIFSLWLGLLTPLVGYIRLLGIIADTHQHYGTSAIAYLVNPITFVLTLVLLQGRLDIYSLLVANLAGHSLELLILFIQVAFRLRLLPLIRPTLHPVVRTILKQSVVPAVMFLAVFLIPTLDRLIASMLAEGSLTTFHYGDRMVLALDLVIQSSALSIIYYYWVNVAAEKGIASVIHGLNDIVTLLWFIILPLSIGGALLSHPIISVLFERGAFTAVTESAVTFALLMLSLPFYYMFVLILWLFRIEKAVNKQTILYIGLVVLSFLFDLLFTPLIGIFGIALSTLLARLLVMMWGYRMLRRHLPDINIRPLFPRIGHTAFCTGVMTLVLLFLQIPIGPTLARANGLLWQITALGGMVLAGGGIYALTAVIVRHPDMFSLADTIARTRYGNFLRDPNSRAKRN